MVERLPTLALQVVREHGMSFATCHVCWMRCEARGRTTDAAMAQLPCRVAMRDWVVDEIERETHGEVWDGREDDGF